MQRDSRWLKNLRPAFSLRSLMLAITFVACVAAIPQKIPPWEFTFATNGEFSDLKISSDGRQLAACCDADEPVISVFDTRTGQRTLFARATKKRQLPGRDGRLPISVEFGCDQNLVGLIYAPLITIWDTSSGEVVEDAEALGRFWNTTRGSSQFGESDFNLVELWEPAYRMQQCPAMARSRFPARLSRNGQVMAFVTRDGIEVWRPARRWRWVTQCSILSAAFAAALVVSLTFDQRRRRLPQQPPPAVTVAT